MSFIWHHIFPFVVFTLVAAENVMTYFHDKNNAPKAMSTTTDRLVHRVFLLVSWFAFIMFTSFALYCLRDLTHKW